MNLDLIFAIIFYGIIYLLFLKYRKRFEVQNKVFVLYKTKLGIKWMNLLAKKFPRFLNVLSYFSILIGFSGMLFIFYILVKGTLTLIIQPTSQPVLSPVLPGVSLPGLPTLSFWHWIISILFIATIHEFSHGIYARLANIKIKSSGFAFLGPILAAFVEPDEKQMAKKKVRKQLAVMSAGPFSNIIAGFVILIISLFIFSPIANSLVDASGVKIVEITKGYSMSTTNVKAGEIIQEINDIPIANTNEFSDVLSKFKPGDKIIIKTSNTTAEVVLTNHPKNSSMPYLGVLVSPEKTEIKPVIKEKYSFLPDVLIWFYTLIFWLYVINIGVGLFNLLPLGPIDGGKMFYLGAFAVFKNKIKAKKLYQFISAFCLILIFINLLPYLIKLIIFILIPILSLF